MKSKTLAAWLSFLGGPLGLHRFYLFGFADTLGWLLPIPTALGVYGIERVQQLGLNDRISWVLIPLLGFTVAGCALTAIIYGLMTPQKWNSRFNPHLEDDAPAGSTNWFTVGAVVLSLMVGATTLIASFAFSFQAYFDYQVAESKKLSQ